MTIKYVINTRVRSVAEEFKMTNYRKVKGTDGAPDYTESDRVSLGWFILLEGSYEKLGVGAEKPVMAKGDRVTITLEKVDG